MVSHGGTIEPALVAALATANHQNWGLPLHHCDAVGGQMLTDLRLYLYGSITAADLLRHLADADEVLSDWYQAATR